MVRGLRPRRNTAYCSDRSASRLWGAGSVRFRVLGPLSVAGNVLAASRERTVLAVLLLEPNRLVPVERLIDAVWGDNPPVTARAQIHTCISRLRRALGPAAGAVRPDPAR